MDNKNNYVGRLKVARMSKLFAELLIMRYLRNYFNDATKLFIDLFLQGKNCFSKKSKNFVRYRK